MDDIRSYYFDPQLFQYSYHVSLAPEFIYVNNAKCGCTTTKASLNLWYAAWHGLPLTYASAGDIHSRAHNPLLMPFQLRPHTDEILLRDPRFFRLTLMREPVSRLTSAYQNKLKHNSIERQRFNLAAGRAEYDDLPFALFLDLLHDQPALLEINEHWRLQSRQIAAPMMKYDRICLQETLDADLLSIRDRLFPGLTLGVFETIKQFPYNKSGSETLLAAMTDAQISTAREIYVEDIALYETIRADRG